MKFTDILEETSSRNPKFGKRKDVKSVTKSELKRKIDDGEWEAVADATRSGYQEIRNTKNNARFTIQIENDPVNESFSEIQLEIKNEVAKFFQRKANNEYALKEQALHLAQTMENETGVRAQNTVETFYNFLKQGFTSAVNSFDR